jgi:hypothetical protein
MKYFVWYSATTKESGEAIASALNCEHGELPPKDSDIHTLICFGAAPSDKFDWNSRTFHKIVNDPRTFRKYVDKKEVAKVINLGVPCRAFYINGKLDSVIRLDNNTRMPNQAFADVSNAVGKLGHPGIVAIDFVGTLDGSGKAVSAVITNVVTGPSLLNLPAPPAGTKSVIGAIAEAFKAPEEDDDKEVLQNLVSNASPAERAALRSLLKRLGETDSAIPKTKKAGK